MQESATLVEEEDAKSSSAPRIDSELLARATEDGRDVCGGGPATLPIGVTSGSRFARASFGDQSVVAGPVVRKGELRPPPFLASTE